MRRQALTFHRACVAAITCFAVACGLDAGGLAVPDDASTVSIVTTTLDGAIALDQEDAAGSSMSTSSSTDPIPADASLDEPTPLAPVDADIADVVLDPDGPTADAGDPCDRDQDGFQSSAAECGGNDCCDFDGRAHPGQTSFFTSADACGSFDYDCNGKADPEFSKVNCTLAVLSCDGSGFDGTPPGCGDTATFDSCDFFLLCYTSQDQKTQACR